MDDFNQNMTLYLGAIKDQLELLRKHIAILGDELDERKHILRNIEIDRKSDNSEGVS